MCSTTTRKFAVRAGSTIVQKPWASTMATTRKPPSPIRRLRRRHPPRRRRRPVDVTGAVSHPKVSHQVETNVVTQADRPPVTLQEFLPLQPHLGRPQTTVKTQSSGAFFAPRSTPLPDGSSAGVSLCLLLTAQYSGTEYPVKAAGRPLILQGS